MFSRFFSRSSDRSSRPGRVSAAEAHRRTSASSPESPVLLDVREPREWVIGHAPDAVHVPLSQLISGASPLPEVVQGRPVVAICRSGNRSQKAAQLLAEQGIDAVDVKGGMEAWQYAGLPIVNGRGGRGMVA
ncbi:rhodanese-like domain-containing protein [Streptomyces tropicalis]|uniref:Rhodanese-like domain-containing protein n=1 Tax=Streptomyces tropicalis TaxID=3034234 RepID=A0ABT6A691_9ACTN|nr:rhodanese-like domain-containing protein [Streptomyces tropicalis]MDF3300161.1 rhodanese-like domain-containing protein [Streptomyces tropicalis]